MHLERDLLEIGNDPQRQKDNKDEQEKELFEEVPTAIKKQEEPLMIAAEILEKQNRPGMRNCYP